MANKKNTTKLIICGIYIFLLAALLFFITAAYYKDSRVAYSSFGAAGFNTVILGGGNTVDDLSAGIIQNYGVEFNTAGYRPGMVGNSKERFPFTVVNGTNNENRAYVDVLYNIRLLTTANLPMTFTLVYNYIADDGPKEEIYRSVVSDEKVDRNGILCNEICFYKTDSEGEITEQAEFLLKGDALSLNHHILELEWLSGEGNNDISYMKEVDVLELLVTASSVNKSEIPGYSDVIIDLQDDATYSSGIIIFDPAKGKVLSDNELTREYVYPIDYRSLKRNISDNVLTFSLDVDNGMKKNVVQEYDFIKYKMELEIPYNEITNGANYTLQYYNTETKTNVPMTITRTEYRQYDLLTDSYTLITQAQAAQPVDTVQYKIYTVYIYERIPGATNIRLYNYIPDATSPTGKSEAAATNHTFTLRVTNPPGIDEVNNVAFSDKIRVVFSTSFENS